ncbi:MAG TPA: ferritin-like domain-containing protein [Kofleriaceae bacterium]|nr:ferritin-like domain-containing protein [Kofleriaceae bacterium]
MHKPTDIGPNRTGVKTSPFDSRKTIQGAEEGTPAAGMADGHVLEVERVRWSREAMPVGTVPPPGTVKGVVKAIVETLEGNVPNVLIDKLGERLAFERTGARLYDALLAKFEAASVHDDGPTRADIEHIRDDERRHFGIVRDAMVQLGADPTAMTPCADIAGVASLGWIQVLGDPRTTLTQALDIMLAVEAADNEGWTLLVELAETMGFADLARQFRVAIAEEEEHLVLVRTWASTAILGQSRAG